MLTWNECIKLLTCGEHEDFNEIYNSKNGDNGTLKLYDGDLILREMNSTISVLYHAGIFTGSNEVIEFTGKK